MLNHRSQFSKDFRAMRNGNSPISWPKDIYKEQLSIWNDLGRKARKSANMSNQDLEFLGLQPSSKGTGKNIVSGVGLWKHILKKNLPHDDLRKYLRWQIDSFPNINKSTLVKTAIKCSLGNNIDFDEMELDQVESKRVYYSRFKEDIRDKYILSELNDRNCKVVHFVQPVWPKEHLELVEAIRLLKECVDKPYYYRSLNGYEINKIIRNKARTSKEVIGYRFWYFDIDQNRFCIKTLKRCLKDLNLYDYLRAIVMTSKGRFHVYLDADLEETAHWDPLESPNLLIKRSREKHQAIWDKLAEALSADVGKALTQKASTPGYKNPRTGETASVVHYRINPKKLTIKEAEQLVLGIFGEEVSIPDNVLRVTRAAVTTGIPSFQQYNDYHNYGDEILNATTLNEKVKKLTTHIHRYLDFPFSREDLDTYYSQTVRPAFGPGEHSESEIHSKFLDWVRNAERFAQKTGFKPKQYISQQQIDEIDAFLDKFEKAIWEAQEKEQKLTTKMEAKIPRLIVQIKQALLDPSAKVQFIDGHLIGKIPCKYLKGPENGLGRYNELIKTLCAMGLIHRDIRYSRPYKLPDSSWAGEARTWRFHLTQMSPQIIREDIWNHSYSDYCYWIEQESVPIPDWIPDYQRLLAA